MGFLIRLVTVAFFLLIFWLQPSAQTLRLSKQVGYQGAYTGTFGMLESGATDSGGVLTFVAENLAAVSDSITHIRFFSGGSEFFPDAWRVWPERLQPAGSINPTAFIHVKGSAFPFRELDTLTVAVYTASGDSARLNNQILHTSPLSIGNIIPGRDSASLWIYLRNEDTTAWQLDTLRLNQHQWVAGTTPGLFAAGGSFMIPSKSVGILFLILPDKVSSCDPLALQLHTTRLFTTQKKWCIAGIRNTEPDFPVGTWHSSGLAPALEFGRKRLRKLPLTSIHGPGNPADMATAENEYFIRTVWEPSFGSGTGPDSSLAGPVVRSQATADHIHLWSVDDEPDISGKPLEDELLKNTTYWRNDFDTPSYVNLAVQKKFSMYGWLADVVAMDHYSAPDAPNIIPLTWVPFVGRVGNIREALEYTEALKRNSEPRRMYAWCQLEADGTWGQQPDPACVDHQFWAHLLGGAKGIDFFTAKSESPDSAPQHWAEVMSLMRQFNSIRDLCLYSEPIRNVDVVTGNVSSGMLVSEKAVVIIVLNDSIHFNFNSSSLGWDTQIDSGSYAIEFSLPSWISTAQVYRVTEAGKESVPGFVALGGGRYRISADIYKDSHVFVIGANDNFSPGPPTRANIPEFIDLANYTLSWKEPADEFGVDGYILKWNGAFVDSVRWPIYEVADGAFNCVTGNWSIEAYDASGNLGLPGFLPITIAITPPAIFSSPVSMTAVAGIDTFFSVSASGAGLHFQWQFLPPGGSWTDVTDTLQYSGMQDSVLWIVAPHDSLNGNQYRCIVSNPCGHSDTTSSATLDVMVSMADIAEHKITATLFPNPASGESTLRLRLSGEHPLHIRIMDAQGVYLQTVYSGVSGGGDFRLNPAGLAQGLYLILIRSEEETLALRWILAADHP